MSSGSYNVTIDSFNSSFKTWSGSNGKTKENPYSVTHRVQRNTMSHRIETWYGVDTVLTDGYLSDLNVAVQSVYSFQNERLAATSKLADSVRGHSFNASVFLGELHQSVDLIASNTVKVLGAYRLCKRGRYADAVRQLGTSVPSGKLKSLQRQDVSAVWLELQFGWKPLLSDIHEAMQALQAIRPKQKVVYRTQASTKRVSGLIQSPKILADYVNTVKIKATFREVPSLLSTLGLTSPLSLVWEKLPWSFVVDYFVPIGAFLDDYSLLAGLRGEFVISSFAKASIHQPNFTSRWAPGGSSLSHVLQYGGSCTSFMVQFTREVTDVLSVPLPAFKDLSKAFSRGHVENLAALVNQQVRISRM